MKKELADRLDKMGYAIYRNNKIIIIKQYNSSGKQNYLRDMKECFWSLICGLLYIIGFPFYLLYTLYQFIPKIHFIKKGEN